MPFSEAAVKTVANAFKIGVQLSTPFIVFGLVFFLGLGILSRLIPQIQVFFIAMPANIYLGVLLFALLLGAMMTWYLAYYEAAIANHDALGAIRRLLLWLMKPNNQRKLRTPPRNGCAMRARRGMWLRARR